MGDYKWLTAVLNDTCSLCGAAIHQGAGFYWEAEKKKPYCRECGRYIRQHGYDKAVMERSALGKMFREAMGGGFMGI